MKRTAFFAATILVSAASRAETAYFLMSGPAGLRTQPLFESYVIAIEDAALISEARDYLSTGGGVPFLVPRAKIAMGPTASNLDYADPDRPAWNWHVSELLEWTVFDPSLPRATVFIPNVDGAPSMVPQLLAGVGSDPPVDEMTLVDFPLVMELEPGAEGGVVGISTRGWVEAGDRILIAGFVVYGKTPRNVVVRGIGPSLEAFGIVDTLADPGISIFRDSEKIAENDDWESGNLGLSEPPAWYHWLLPTNSKESALQLALPPGTYTVHVRGVDGGSGIGLVEVCDLDALNPN